MTCWHAKDRFVNFLQKRCVPQGWGKTVANKLRCGQPRDPARVPLPARLDELLDDRKEGPWRPARSVREQRVDGAVHGLDGQHRAEPVSVARSMKNMSVGVSLCGGGGTRLRSVAAAVLARRPVPMRMPRRGCVRGRRRGGLLLLLGRRRRRGGGEKIHPRRHDGPDEPPEGKGIRTEPPLGCRRPPGDLGRRSTGSRGGRSRQQVRSVGPHGCLDLLAAGREGGRRAPAVAADPLGRRSFVS